MNGHRPGPWALMAGMPTNVLDSGGLRVARCDYDGDFDSPEAHANARLIARAPAMLAELTALTAERDALRKDVERLRIRNAAYEEAYGIAYQATFQSHNGHWDATMQGGKGCPECIRAQEARENCNAALRRGLEGLIDAAMSAQAGSSPSKSNKV